MRHFTSSHRVAAAAVAACAGALVLASAQVTADGDDHGERRHVHFKTGNLVVSRSVYDNNPNNVEATPTATPLPPDCPPASGACVAAIADGTYPTVWNNDTVDASFGITSKIFLDQMTPSGLIIDSLEVPNSAERHHSPHDQLVTSFSSKSELALNLSTSGRYITFMGYVAPIDTLDASNSNTPGAVAQDPTDPSGDSYFRAVAQVDAHGRFHFTETTAYSGNNGRAAILHDSDGANAYFTAGNAGNGSLDPQPNGIIVGAGAQIVGPSAAHESDQTPGIPTPVASFWVSELGADPAKLKDKVGKDDNFRGLTIHDNVLYFSKGSGSNGVNTVYFVDTTGLACPKGTGVPQAGATLPTAPLVYNIADLPTKGLPNNMCILSGFQSTPNKTKGFTVTDFPFGIWFADDKTLYVADEGDGVLANAGSQTKAGLQKWVLESGTWIHVYTLQAGLQLGVQYSVAGYPTGNNPATGGPWSPATDGLRNITGRVNRDGTVTVWAITSTVSGNGDQGADPNRLVVITDRISNTDASWAAAHESFTIMRTAKFAEVLRGVSLTPRDDDGDDDHDSDHDRGR